MHEDRRQGEHGTAYLRKKEVDRLPVSFLLLLLLLLVAAAVMFACYCRMVDHAGSSSIDIWCRYIVVILMVEMVIVPVDSDRDRAAMTVLVDSGQPFR